ncbi:MAG: hypothetical protein CMD83_18260 [Gammaproteobacteria bacterium]|nr:hypothetical protein [Gammaproteobacteria bacterium]
MLLVVLHLCMLVEPFKLVASHQQMFQQSILLQMMRIKVNCFTWMPQLEMLLTVPLVLTPHSRQFSLNLKSGTSTRKTLGTQCRSTTMQTATV